MTLTLRHRTGEHRRPRAGAVTADTDLQLMLAVLAAGERAFVAMLGEPPPAPFGQPPVDPEQLALREAERARRLPAGTTDAVAVSGGPGGGS